MADRNPDDIFYRVDNDNIFGISYEKWTEKWWNWLLGIPKEENPANDPSGAFGVNKQPDNDVWYLVGTMNRKAKREIEFPSKRAILFPLYCEENSEFEKPAMLHDEIRDLSKDGADDMYSLALTIDEGTKNEMVFNTGLLCQYKVISQDLFNVEFTRKNVFDTKDGKCRAIAAGYWVFLKEDVLGPGKHRIWFRGLTKYYDNEVTYNLTFKNGTINNK